MAEKRFWPVLLALLPLLIVGPALFAGNAIGPFDQIATMAPWNAEPSGRAWDVLQADAVLQFYVWRDLVFESWRSGQVPFWNPHQLGGTPLLANSQSAPLYPLHILLSSLPTPLALNLLAWFHLALGALGVRALTLRLGSNEPGALFAGAVFALSPFMVAWTVLPSVITTCAYIPWVVAHILGIFQKQKTSGPLLALTVGLLLLAGHLQFAFYGHLAALLAGLWLTASHAFAEKSFPVKPFLTAFAATALGLGLCLVQLLPVREYSQFSHRQAAATEEGYQAYVAGAVQPFELVAVVAPGFVGTPGRAETGVETPFPYPTYWPQFVKPGANYAESAVTLGPAVLLGLFLLRRKTDWKTAGAVALVGATGLLLALGTPLNAALYFGIPGFAATGSPGRAAILFVLAAAVLAGRAIGQTKPEDAEESAPTKPDLKQLAPLFATVVIALLAIPLQNSASSLEPWIPNADIAFQVARRLTETLPIVLVSLLATAAAWFLLVRKKQPLPAVGTLLLAHLAIAQIFILPHGRLPQTDLPDPNPAERHAFLNAPWDFITAAPAAFPPNTASLYRLNDAAGYDSLLHRDTVARLRAINNGEDPAPPVNGNIMYVKPGFDLPALQEAGVTHVWARDPEQLQGLPATPTGNLYRAETQGPGVVSYPRAPGTLAQNALNRFTVQAEGPGPLVFRQSPLPGWSATINGQPAPIQPPLTVELPDGPQTVVFTYTAPGYQTGLVATLVSLLVLALWTALTLRPASKDQPQEPTQEPQNP